MISKIKGTWEKAAPSVVLDRIVGQPTSNKTEPYFMVKPKEKRSCRFCGSVDIRAQGNNGVLGPGYAEWGFYCAGCGKAQ